MGGQRTCLVGEYFLWSPFLLLMYSLLRSSVYPESSRKTQHFWNTMLGWHVQERIKLVVLAATPPTPSKKRNSDCVNSFMAWRFRGLRPCSKNWKHSVGFWSYPSIFPTKPLQEQRSPLCLSDLKFRGPTNFQNRGAFLQHRGTL